jgi:hypothetical protein
MVIYEFSVKTKWGWRAEVSTSKKALEDERDFDKRHGYKVTDIVTHKGKVVRVICGKRGNLIG